MNGQEFTRTGTISGTLLVLFIQLNPAEVLKTAVLAAIGAVVSFLVSRGMWWVMRRMGRKERDR